jgi:hypothetical protein
LVTARKSVTQIDERVGANGWERKVACHNFALALQGSANEWRTWILKINIKDDRKTWAALKSLLKAKFAAQSGRFLRTKDHVTTTDESEDLEIDSKTLDWHWNTTEFFSHDNEEAVNQAAQDLKARHNGEFEGSELFKKLDQLPTIWNFTLPVIIILVVVACVVVFCK